MSTICLVVFKVYIFNIFNRVRQLYQVMQPTRYKSVDQEYIIYLTSTYFDLLDYPQEYV